MAKRRCETQATLAQLTVPFSIDAGGFGNECHVLPPSVEVAIFGQRPDPHPTPLSAQPVRSLTQERSITNAPGDAERTGIFPVIEGMDVVAALDEDFDGAAG